jgi:hypothetical protein
MESFLSSHRGSSTPQYNYDRAGHNGDNVLVLRQAFHVPDVQACKHCAEVQDSLAGEGIAEEESAEPVWSVILQRNKAQGLVGLGEVLADSQARVLIMLTIPHLQSPDPSTPPDSHR